MRWKLVINNRIQCYGRCDHGTKTISINIRAHMRDAESLHDTLIHEYLHKRFPHCTEKQIEAMTDYRGVTPQEWRYVARLFQEGYREWLKTNKPLIPHRNA